LATEEQQMTAAREVIGSSYMHWAKTRSVAKYNLATSGLGNVKLSELRVSLDDLELTEGGYGYQPLIQSIATRYRVAPAEVVNAAGTTFANHLAMAALIKPGDEILFEHPAYEPMLALARYLGADVKRFSRRFEDGFQIVPEELDRLVTPKLD
jgi:DNA-binding transcriptional MocR family regulator